MGGGGGTQRTVTDSNPRPMPGLESTYREFGNMATQFMQNFGPELFGFLGDQTPQQIAGPTDLQNDAYRQQVGLLNSQGPQAWSDALGMYGAAGNLPQWGGVDLSGITGWGSQPTQGSQPQKAGFTPQAAFGQQQMTPAQYQSQARAGAMGLEKGADLLSNDDGSGTGGGGVGGAGTTANAGNTTGTIGSVTMPWETGRTPYVPTDYPGGATINPAGNGASPWSGNPMEPGGANATPWTQANPNAGGVKAPGMGQAGGSGTVREIDLSKYGGGGGGGGGGNFSFSSGGGGDYQELDRIGNPLESIDFANHPALKSALDTFAKTALPGIENSMIGAGLGRSGAAGNAIATGKAQMALPVMQQLIQGELTNKGLDVNQRGQDYAAQTAAMQAATQAAMQGASLSQQNMLARLAAEQTMRGQDIQLRGQDIQSLLEQGSQSLQARGMDINALLGGAGGLAALGGADLNRITGNIGNSWDMGESVRGMQNQANESQFNAANRPYERIMQFMQPLVGGAVGNAGTSSVSTQTGGGGK